MSIKITNSRIINFYKANPSQDIERNNIFLIEFIERVKQDLENGINTSETLQYLDNFKHLVDNNFKTLETKVSEIDVSSEIKALESKIQVLNKETEQISEIKSILTSQKTNFTKELESMIKNSENTNKVTISDILDKKHENIINNLSAELNRTNSENNNTLSSNIKSQLHEKFTEIKKETDKILNADNSNNNKVIEDYFNKINNALQIAKVNNENEKNNNIERQETLVRNNNDLLFEKLKPSLEKLDNYIDLQSTTNSSRKGSVSEIKMENILNKCFPSATVENTTGNAHCGDFLVNYKSSISNKTIPIMVENKCYKNNVREEEVVKFIGDVKFTDNHGIFFSQTSGIATKNNFDIDFEDNKVLIYLHNVNYDENLIISAFRIMEVIISKINLSEVGSNISEEKLQNVKNELLEFFIEKDKLIKDANEIISLIKKNLIKKLDRMKFPTMASLVNVSISNTGGEHVCEICAESFASKSALGSHKKKHNNEQMNKVISVNT